VVTSLLARAAARARRSAALWRDALASPPPPALFALLGEAAAAHAGAGAAGGASAGAGAGHPRSLQLAAARLLDEAAAAAAPPRVAVRASSLGPGTGRGVFAARDLRIGEALTLYPGALFTSPTVPALEGAALDVPAPPPPAPLPADESFTAARPDGVLIDALALASDAGLAALLAARGGLAAEAAVGHILQHGAPNAACVPVDLNVLEGSAGGIVPAPGARGSRARRELPFAFSPADDAAAVLPWRLVPRLPYFHAEAGGVETSPLPPLPPFADPGRKRALVLPVLLIVAAADVKEGTELFIDYALAPKGEPPAWYRHTTVSERWRRFESVKARVEELRGMARAALEEERGA